MQFPVAARFVERVSGDRVPGIIQPAIEEHLLLWGSWRYRPRDEDRGWDWWSIFQECRLSGGRFECYAALAEGSLQGLMSLNLRGKRNRTSQGIIIDHLATNPANRTAGLGLKYVGIGLIGLAVARSIECGAGGRIWLESLPGAAGFYESLGMSKQPRQSQAGNLVYTVEAAKAEELLEEIKRQGIVEL